MLFVKRSVIITPKTFRCQGTYAAIQEKFGRHQEQSATVIDNEYTEKPEYPEILDMSYEQRKIRKKQEWYDAIKKLNTVEEKLLKINMPRYYGYKTVALKGDQFPYNCLPLTQHYTRTLFEQVDQLPGDSYKKNESNIHSFVDCFKSKVQDAIEFSAEIFKSNHSNKDLKREEIDKLKGEIIVEQLNHVLINSLMADCHHLSAIDIDLYPRHEAFWFVGGVNPSKSAQKQRRSLSWTKKYENDPYDRPIQYMGKPYLALRHKHPLQPIVPSNEAVNSIDSSKVPLYKFDSRVVGYHREHRHGTTIPGFWPGNPYEFGLLSYQNREYLEVRNPAFGIEDFKEVLHAQGIQSSYAWLYAQACYQGFSTFHDLTYPLTTQTIITNGQAFSFYVYQLNTTLIHAQHVYDNPRVNYCWGTKELKLFEEIDENGKCIGFNDDVLKQLIHFYVNEPTVRDNVNLKPYLGEKERKIADIVDDERRIFLEQKYKHMTTNRPRHSPIPEIYAWEKIYKIDHKTRPMEPRRRFFELGINPFKRTMDNHPPEYIPKSKRPGGPKSKKKFMKMYYP